MHDNNIDQSIYNSRKLYQISCRGGYYPPGRMDFRIRRNVGRNRSILPQGRMISAPTASFDGAVLLTKTYTSRKIIHPSGIILRLFQYSSHAALIKAPVMPGVYPDLCLGILFPKRLQIAFQNQFLHMLRGNNSILFNAQTRFN